MSDKPRCFECGSLSQQDHHVVPRSLGGTRTVPLCEVCHGRAHGRSDGFQSIGYLTRAALAAKKTRGERAGTVPYGYTADETGKLSEHPGEQAIIAQVHALRAAGLSLRGIVSELTRAGLVGRTGRPLALPQVARIVRGAL